MTTGPVSIWQWDLDDPALADAAALSLAERARAGRFVVPQAGQRFTTGRAALRQTLASLCGVPAADLVIRTGPNGKPFLPDGPHFNLGHSGAVALFAVADFPVGIDVEAVRPLEPGLADLVFTQSERAYLASLSRLERQAAFFRGWTRKEAVIKANGGSIADLRAIDILPEVRLPGWQVIDLAVSAGYAAAVGAPCRGWAVRWQDPGSGARQPPPAE